MTAMVSSALSSAIASVPPGRWAVGVSGGADSVALLYLLRERTDLSLHVVHLDHETRGGESATDAAFVAQLAAAWGLPCTVAVRSEVERSMARVEKNTSARYRAARLELFRRVIETDRLLGVVLAHHADDQAETVLQRLLRGSGPAGLTGMAAQTTIGGVVILRPLLGVRGVELRGVLAEKRIAFREDSSNALPVQQRNRVRELLLAHPSVTTAALEVTETCAELVAWMRQRSPRLGDSFPVDAFADLPEPLARESARRWLSERAGGDAEVTPAVQRLLEMARDAATPARQHFPGGVIVRRRGGKIFADDRSGATGGMS